MRLAAIAAYVAGESLSAIQTRLGVSRTTVARWVRAAGHPVLHHAGRLLTETQRAELATDYANGESLRVVAARFGISTQAVTSCLSEHGIETRPEPRRHTGEVRAAAVEAYLAGSSLAVVAGEFGVSPSTVRDWLIRAGERPRPSPHAPRDRSAIVDAYRHGESIAAIARRTGHNPQSVRRWVHDEGVPIRPPQWRPPGYEVPRVAGSADFHVEGEGR